MTVIQHCLTVFFVRDAHLLSIESARAGSARSGSTKPRRCSTPNCARRASSTPNDTLHFVIQRLEAYKGVCRAQEQLSGRCVQVLDFCIAELNVATISELPAACKVICQPCIQVCYCELVVMIQTTLLSEQVLLLIAITCYPNSNPCTMNSSTMHSSICQVWQAGMRWTDLLHTLAV